MGNESELIVKIPSGCRFVDIKKMDKHTLVVVYEPEPQPYRRIGFQYLPEVEDSTDEESNEPEENNKK